jgi:hypothetical protein
MAVKQIYPAQTEIPEFLREHYVEQDGHWLLQTDPPMEDVSGLKNALDAERRLRRDAEKQFNDTKIKFEGIDPEDVRKLQDRIKGLDEADIYDKQGLDALVLKRTESMKTDYERLMRQKDTEIIQLREGVADLDRRWRSDRIKTALLDAASKAGVAKYAMDDAVERGMKVFTDLDERGAVVARNGDDLRYGKDGINPLTPDEWIVALKPDAPHLWPASAGGGAPSHHGGTGPSIDWQSLPPTERLTKWRQQQGALSRP